MKTVVGVLGPEIDILPVIQVPISLYGLRSEIDRMAGEEEVVLGRDGEGVAHECCGVDGEGAGHGPGNAVGFYNQFLTFEGRHEVGDEGFAE